MKTFSPNDNDGFYLPSNLRRTDPPDFQMKGATGFTMYWKDNSIHKFGFFPMDGGIIRFFGGTESPNSIVPGYIQSLMWMADRHYHLPPTSVLGFRILHRLHVRGAPLLEDKGLPDIPDREEHGLIPVDPFFAECHPDTVWVWMKGGRLTASQSHLHWTNATVARIASDLIHRVTAVEGDIETLYARQEVEEGNPFRGPPVSLNACMS